MIEIYGYRVFGKGVDAFVKYAELDSGVPIEKASIVDGFNYIPMVTLATVNAAMAEMAKDKVERDTRPYAIGDLTMKYVFEANGMVNMHDLQLVLNYVEQALQDSKDAYNRRQDRLRDYSFPKELLILALKNEVDKIYKATVVDENDRSAKLDFLGKVKVVLDREGFSVVTVVGVEPISVKLPTHKEYAGKRGDLFVVPAPGTFVTPKLSDKIEYACSLWYDAEAYWKSAENLPDDAVDLKDQILTEARNLTREAADVTATYLNLYEMRVRFFRNLEQHSNLASLFITQIGETTDALYKMQSSLERLNK